MLRRFDPSESQITQIALTLLRQQLLKLLDRLGSDLVVHVVDASKGRLSRQGAQDMCEGLVFQSVVVQVDLADRNVSDLLLLNSGFRA